MATSEKHDVPTGTESDASGSSSFEGINEKALLRKLDYRLLPPLTLLYLLSFLDRSNVGNARLEGMTEDINMCTFLVCFTYRSRANWYIAGNQYLTGLTLYFIGYVLFEIPCNVRTASSYK